jgi:hypothetical protein
VHVSVQLDPVHAPRGWSTVMILCSGIIAPHPRAHSPICAVQSTPTVLRPQLLHPTSLPHHEPRSHLRTAGRARRRHGEHAFGFGHWLRLRRNQRRCLCWDCAGWHCVHTMSTQELRHDHDHVVVAWKQYLLRQDLVHAELGSYALSAQELGWVLHLDLHRR